MSFNSTVIIQDGFRPANTMERELVATARETHIDIAKFLGTILIVIGHSSALLEAKNGYLFHAIYSFHVPLFFFLSGIFLSKNSSFKAQFYSKLDSLLKPYFVISILLIIRNL